MSSTATYTRFPWLLNAARVLFFSLCLVVAWYHTQRMDIGLYDETAYLQRGAKIDTIGLPTADMAPLYSLWYRFLQLLIGDPVQRYFANQFITVALLPIGTYLLLLQLGTTQRASFITSIFLLFSTLNVLNWPRVSVFAMLVLLTGLLLALRSRDRDRQWASVVSAIAVCVFIRPEFALSLGCAFLLWLADLARRRKSLNLAAWMPVAFTGAFALLLFLALGDPFANGRSMVAFGQHYALNVAETTDSTTDPWTNWEAIARKDLGTTASVSQALRNAPEKIVWHLGTNLRNTAATLARMLLPAGARVSRMAMLLILIMVGAVAILAWKGADRTWRSHGFFVVASAVICLPAVLSAIIIYPRQHYLIFPVSLLIILFVNQAYPRNAHRPRWAMVPAIAAVLIMLLYLRIHPEPLPRPVLATINALRTLPADTELVILDADGGYDAYLGSGAKRIIAQNKDRGFDEFIAQHGIHVIVASPRLLNDHRYQTDPTWRAFLNGLNDHGFRKVSVNGTGTTLYIARTIMY
ncbi:MAG TPA: hypothetical protein PL070_04610 [Flavobacteriales bacterium]|nr:hypothetical protein [Flavobacteriales bacterium]